MIEIHGDIWKSTANVICVTTNSIIKSNGELVMGVGIAKQAALRYPELPKVFGTHVAKFGNSPCVYHAIDGKIIVSLPTKYHWKDKSNMQLICQSVFIIQSIFNKETVALPRPGCGCGGLIWNDVKSNLNAILDEDRFIVMER